MEREEIRFVQAMYHQLNLTPQQAEKVLQYENMRDSYSRTDMFSAWEEWDFEYSVFQDLLSEHQMVQYQQRVREMEEKHIERLVDQDNSNKHRYEQMREQIGYLKTKLIPSILFDPSHMVLSFIVDRNKIDYIRADYRTFLHAQRKKILVDHFRYNKTYAPVQLKSRLLEHYASCLIPDYAAFENWMDEPARAVAAFIKKKLPPRTSEFCEFYLGKLEESKAFALQLKEKYYRHIDGWHVLTQETLSEDDEKRNWMMSMLLLDAKAYGFEDMG